MISKISHSASSASSNRARTAAHLARLSISRFTRPFAEAVSLPATHPTVSPVRLWDSSLLDRLHAPLTRYRD